MAGEAAIIIAMQNKCLRRFLEHNALSPDQAKTVEELGLRKNPFFNRFLRRGILVQTSEDRYYMIPEKAEEFKRQRKRHVFIALAVILAAIALIAWLV